MFGIQLQIFCQAVLQDEKWLPGTLKSDLISYGISPSPFKTLVSFSDIVRRGNCHAYFSRHLLHSIIPCLVHVSLHPLICHLLRGISIPTFSSTEFLHVYVFFLVPLYLHVERLLAFVWANLHNFFCQEFIHSFIHNGLLRSCIAAKGWITLDLQF